MDSLQEACQYDVIPVSQRFTQAVQQLHIASAYDDKLHVRGKRVRLHLLDEGFIDNPAAAAHHQHDKGVKSQGQLLAQPVFIVMLTVGWANRDARYSDFVVSNAFSLQSCTHAFGANQIQIRRRMYPIAVIGMVGNDRCRRKIRHPFFLKQGNGG
ncbi:hypothetical protein D3C74_261320 [compost metagenome]